MLFMESSYKKKHENRNNVSPHRNHDIHYFFCNLVVHEMKKKQMSNNAI